jgi:hypothetical protein
MDEVARKTLETMLTTEDMSDLTIRCEGHEFKIPQGCSFYTRARLSSKLP